jgi:PAS domain-containing protein
MLHGRGVSADQSHQRGKRRGENTVIDVRSDQTARLRSFIAKARGIFWEATVTRDPAAASGFAWDLHFFDEEATRRVLPIAIAAGQSFTEAWHLSKLPEDRVAMREASARALEANLPEYVHEFRWRRADGTIRWLREDVHLEATGPGRWRFVGICTDVTERKLAELKPSQARTLEPVGRLPP